jgi:hypothetical protein
MTENKAVDGPRDAGHHMQMVETYSDLIDHAGAIICHADARLEDAMDLRSKGAVAWV